MALAEEGDQSGFERFFADAEPRLRRALTAAYGAEVGREAAADAWVYGWQHRTRLQSMRNPVGYLYRVGQTSARRQRRTGRAAVERPSQSEQGFEPALTPALAALPERQRTVLFLVYGEQWSHSEVAAVLGLRKATVQRHLERGLASLRKAIGEVSD